MGIGQLGAGSRGLAAVVLAGGQGRRLGGRDKPMVAVGGRAMVLRVLDAVAAVGASPRVVVGPVRAGLPDDVITVIEEPAGGGPVAAAAAGVRAVDNAAGNGPRDDAGLVVLLAADLPLLTGKALETLVGVLSTRRDKDGAVFVDDGGRRQLLCGVWRINALRGAIDGFGAVDGGSLRRLTAGLDVAEVRAEIDGTGALANGAPYLDCDTEEDLRTVDENLVRQWLVEAAQALGVAEPTAEERKAVLDLARDVAHNVARPGAPLTAYLLGVAVGRGADAQAAGEILRGLATRSE